MEVINAEARYSERALGIHACQKEVVALRDIEGFSYDAIAEITGLNLGTLKSRLARARLSLREKLRSVL